jgi:hypothetical protein
MRHWNHFIKEKPMSRINFIKGSLKGRLGEIVGSSWKGIPYTKTYTKPRNPNSPAQQETRYLFQQLAHIGKGIRTPLDQYTRPKPQKMSAYNHFVQLNKQMFEKTGTKWAPLELVIMSGELTSAAIATANFDSSAFTATITWDGTAGEATDKAFVLIFDDESKHTAYVADIARSAGTATIDASSLANVSAYNDMYAYLAFYRIAADGSGSNSVTTAMKTTKT